MKRSPQPMKYYAAYTFFHKKPDGIKNLLWCYALLYLGCLLQLFAPIAILGYLAGVGRRLVDEPEMKTCAKFDQKQLWGYFLSGLWQVPLLFILITGGVIIGFAAQFIDISLRKTPRQTRDLLMAIHCITTAVVMFYVMWPMFFYVHIRGYLHPRQAVIFMIQMNRLVGAHMAATYIAQVPWVLVLWISSYTILFGPLVLVTMLMAQEHLMVQLYRLYLERGGVPIEDIGREADDDEEEE
ncbi:MAG: hypothetical protein ACRC8S_04555 [Fimbriiglobus sp.]